MQSQALTKIKQNEFLVGSYVIYALHGKCQITAKETRKLLNEPMEFYKLEAKKNSASRKPEPAIWVPVESAYQKGMRPLMKREEAEEALGILSSREYYFKLTEPWNHLLPHFENTARLEGGPGMAKVISFLHVYRKKQWVPATDLLRYQESLHKRFFKELSEVLGEPAKELEERAIKGMKVKLLPDS